MKKFLALTLLFCLVVCSTCAQAFESSLGYSIELTEDWMEVSPLTLPTLEKKGLKDSLATLGLDDAYFANYAQRSHELIFCTTGEYGNIVVRQIAEENSVGSTLETYLYECEEYVVPTYTNAGFSVIMKPQLLEMGGREWVALGLGALGREVYQYMTINEHTGRWFNFTATRVPNAVLTPLLETLVFAE